MRAPGRAPEVNHGKVELNLRGPPPARIAEWEAKQPEASPSMAWLLFGLASHPQAVKILFPAGDTLIQVLSAWDFSVEITHFCSTKGWEGIVG